MLDTPQESSESSELPLSGVPSRPQPRSITSNHGFLYKYLNLQEVDVYFEEIEKRLKEAIRRVTEAEKRVQELEQRAEEYAKHPLTKVAGAAKGDDDKHS